MSKFNNPARALGPSHGPVVEPPVIQDFRPSVSKPPVMISELSAPRENSLTAAGFFWFCAFLLSIYLNDWSFRLLGGKAYLSTVCVVVVPAIWLVCGRALSGFQDKVGIWWTALLLLMLMGIPFSFWRGGSFVQSTNYSFRALSFFFYVVAFTTTLKRCRSLMMVNVAISVIVVMSCIFFGTYNAEDGRFGLANSVFFGNSNELALQLLLGVCGLLYLFLVGGMASKLFAVCIMLVSLTYMLKTGSRGCLISAAVLFVTAIMFSKQRVLLTMAALPVVGLALLLSPSSSLHRLTLIFGASKDYQENDLGALQSTSQRTQLLKKSIEFTFTHPLLGVGMGQFAVAYTGEAEKKGEHAAFLGSHNSYTQVSSECGIPAFVCYMSIICITLSRSLRLYRRAHGKPQLKHVAGMALCLFATAITYSVATFFFHMAYTVLLPLLSGQVTALHYVAEPVLREAEAKPA